LGDDGIFEFLKAGVWQALLNDYVAGITMIVVRVL
jgi:hypothetical protein